MTMDEKRSDPSGVMVDGETWWISGGYGEKSDWGRPQVGKYLQTSIQVKVMTMNELVSE